jgi:hypothetical protein
MMAPAKFARAWREDHRGVDEDALVVSLQSPSGSFRETTTLRFTFKTATNSHSRLIWSPLLRPGSCESGG